MIHSKYYPVRDFLLPVVISLFFLSGCGFKTDQYSHDILINPTNREVKNNTIDPNITYDYIMKSDGYIVGIEKTRGIGDYLTKCSDESFENQHSSLCKTVSSHTPNGLYGKNTILTHIISFSPDDKPKPSYSECILFNAYGDIQNKRDITPCQNARISSETDKFDYMKEAVDSINLLKNDIRLRIEKKRPTHIFLVSTGWNTAQGESIQNYNDLFTNLKKAANKKNEKFEPLIVGITWHSYIANATQGTVDVGIAGNDADEVGVFWAGPVLHKVLEPLGAEYRIPVRLIGHSFGCRVVTQALSSKSLYENTSNSSKPVSYGLQCAFSGNRFLSKNTGKRSEDDSLENFSEVSEKQFYTTSDYDKAVQKPAEIGIPYVGSKEFFKIAGEDSDFKKIITQSTIEIPNMYISKLDCKGDKITLINASKIIKDRAPGTGKGGGSHSDVWDAEAGDLIWNLLKVCESK